MAANWKVTSGTLTNTTVSIPANARRRELIISNNSDEVMTYSPDGAATASASVGIAIPAGTALRLGQGGEGQSGVAPGNAGTLFCAGTSKAYSYAEC